MQKISTFTVPCPAHTRLVPMSTIKVEASLTNNVPEMVREPPNELRKLSNKSNNI